MGWYYMSEENYTHTSDLELWMDIWDEQQKEMPPAEKLTPRSPVADSIDTTQDIYYDYLDNQLISETSDPKLVNPIYTDTNGPDSDLEPEWVKEDLLKEVERLKTKLFSLENSLATMGQKKKVLEKPLNSTDSDQKLFDEIKKMRDSIEKVSNQLGLKEEPSVFKR